MAINLGNFGNMRADTRLANVTSIAGQSIQSTAPVRPGELMVALGNQLADDTNQQVQQLQKARAAEHLATLGVKADEMRLQAYDDVLAGKIKPEEMLKTFNERLTEYQDGVIASVPDPALAESLRPAMQEYSIRQQSQVMLTQHSLVRDEHGKIMDGTLANIEITAITNPKGASDQMRAVINTTGANRGWTEQQRAEEIRKRQQNYYLTSDKHTISNTNDIAALEKLAEGYAGTERTEIYDTDQRLAMYGFAKQRIEQIKSNAEAEARVNDANAMAIVDAYDTSSGMGMSIDPQLAATVHSFTRHSNPKIAKAAQVAVAKDDTRKLAAGATFNDQAQALRVLDGEAAKTSDPTQLTALQNQTKILQENYQREIKLFREAPFTSYLAAKTGKPRAALDFGGGNMTNFAASAEQRARDLRELKAVSGMDAPFVEPNEAKAMKSSFNAKDPAGNQILSPQKKGEILGVVGRASGDNIGATSDTVARELGYDYAFAMNAIVQGWRSTPSAALPSGANVADIILEGADIANSEDKAKQFGWYAKKDKQADVDARIMKELKGVFGNDPTDNRNVATVKAVKSAALGLAKVYNEFGDEIDDSRIRSAVSLVTGGIRTVNGKPTIAPYGMSQEKMDTLGKSILNTVAADFGNNENIKRNGSLIPETGTPDGKGAVYTIGRPGNSGNVERLMYPPGHPKAGQAVTVTIDTQGAFKIVEQEESKKGKEIAQKLIDRAKPQAKPESKPMAGELTPQEMAALSPMGRVTLEQQQARDAMAKKIKDAEMAAAKSQGATDTVAKLEAERAGRGNVAQGKPKYSEGVVDKQQILQEELDRQSKALQDAQRKGNADAIRFAEANIRDIKKQMK